MRTLIIVAAVLMGVAVCGASVLEEPSAAIRPRLPAPRFSANAVVNEKFTTVSLDDHLKKGKWVVLVFFPFAFTYTCPTEIIAFSDHLDEFQALNAEVLAISTDSHHTLLAWARIERSEGGLGNISIPLLADISKRISRSYGVLVDNEDDPMFGVALRGLFIIDPRGTVRCMQINDDSVGRSVNEAVRLLQAFRFADEHKGEVCPANWKPGDATIKADPEASKEFFRAAFTRMPVNE